MKKIFKFLLSFFILFNIVSCNNNSNNNIDKGEYVSHTFNNEEYKVYKDEAYNSKYEVAIYIHYYHKLPKNYYTKSEAKNINFEKEWTITNKISIGGDVFRNREQLLPLSNRYTECDIDSFKDFRGRKRIVFSDTFKIYYTDNHYGSFEEIIFNA